VEAFWDGLFAYVSAPGPDAEPPVRGALTLESTRWQYLNGVPDESLVSPDTWTLDQALLDRPGNDEIQLRLFRDYPTNVDLYPAVHEYFRTSRVPLLAVWGAYDEIFGPEGARAFHRDLPDAEIHLLESGHFALESHLDAITGYIRGFLGRQMRAPHRAIRETGRSAPRNWVSAPHTPESSPRFWARAHTRPQLDTACRYIP
jgi:pimeloyl-ACP methyl ester carboxylesterase